MATFKARLDIIGINPFVFVPQDILLALFTEAGKDMGHIPVCGLVNGKPFEQTLLRYEGEWRLYINTTMLSHSPKRIGEILEVSIDIDKRDRTLYPHPDLTEALSRNKEAEAVFNSLPPSRRKEIIRYIASLKTSESRAKNIQLAIGFLLGKNRFMARDKP
ncbi:YdeI/OmpD-associated family protein [Mucilaginibacter calamicampi]|uniref:YdeI/OmpD-associated family protein n=1 Tax=Mucilaginibacter calamicampi TaxID=1302352 RepID=A0ABW2Z264_9SPHI